MLEGCEDYGIVSIGRIYRCPYYRSGYRLGVEDKNNDDASKGAILQKQYDSGQYTSINKRISASIAKRDATIPRIHARFSKYG